MGNCCEAILINTENDAENLIRESIQSLKIHKYSLTELETGLAEQLGIPLLEVKSSKWITKEIYKNICLKYFIENNRLEDQELQDDQKSCLLKYNDSLDGKCFSFCLAIWICSNLDRKYFKDKLYLVEEIILKSDEILTVLTFKKFILRLIEIALYKITYNFVSNKKIVSENILSLSYEKLINYIYNRKNIEDYKQNHIDKIKGLLLTKDSVEDDQLLLETNKNIENEFLKKKFIKHFFIENIHLLDALSIREHFYHKYNNQFIDEN